MADFGTYGLGTNQKAKLEEAFNLALNASGSGRYAQSYDLLFALISNGPDAISDANAASVDLSSWELSSADKFSSNWSAKTGVDKGAWVFIRGVAEVNWGAANPEGEGDYSKFIRDYTKAQHDILFGQTMQIRKQLYRQQKTA